jgi:hypothetical protein
MAASPQNRAFSGALLASAAVLGLALFLGTTASANLRLPAPGQPGLVVADDDDAPLARCGLQAPGLAAGPLPAVDRSPTANGAAAMCPAAGWKPIPVGHCKIPPANDDSPSA